MKKFVDKALHGELDSDRHLVSIFSIALACKGKTYVELGVREGHTSEPIYEAAKLNEGHLWSVDLNLPSEYKPNNGNYTFTQKDSIKFLEEWDVNKKIDFVIELNVSKENLYKRIENRAVETNEARADDKEEILKFYRYLYPA